VFRSLNSGWVPQLPGLFASVADETSAAVVANAVFAGMRFFDAAPSYRHTRAEIRPGRGLDLYACLRVRILTNLGITMSTLCPEQPGLYVDAEPFTPPRANFRFSEVRPTPLGSMQLLGNLHVPILFMHEPGYNKEQATTENLAALVELRN
jgi:D-threo-aldose 1-dehydrogenase